MTHPLLPDTFYHIYNRGNNGENIFYEERNYRHFLALYSQHISPVANTFAYCLLRNHFHLLIQTKTTALLPVETAAVSETAAVLTALDSRQITRKFNNFFIAYAKAINKAYDRTGSLFEPRFERRKVDNQNYFIHLVNYIHCNPQKHGFVDDFREWPWSSYHTMLSVKPTRLERDVVLAWYGGSSAFVKAHGLDGNEGFIASVLVDSFA